MRRRKRKNSFYFVFMFAILVSISLGYAYLERTININGSSMLAGNTWKIQFENFIVTEGSVTPTQDVTFDDKKATIDFGVVLDLPGEFYEFKVDVQNKGSIGASLDEISYTELTTEQKKYLKFDVTYADGTPINRYDFLEKDNSMTMLVRVEYIRYADENEITPAVDQYLNLNVALKYVQDDGLTKNFMDRIKLGAKTDEFVNFGAAASASNGQGVMLMSSTKNDEYPIYYYRGNVDNNNVRWANKCWKIIRTTDTGGVKMIYNGLPAEDGSCNNTGSQTAINSTSTFNSSASPTATGYKYGSPITYSSKDLTSTITYFSYRSITCQENTSGRVTCPNLILYSKAVWDSSISKYNLSFNSSTTSVPLSGYFTCNFEGTSYGTCSANQLYYIFSVSHGSSGTSFDSSGNRKYYVYFYYETFGANSPMISSAYSAPIINICRDIKMTNCSTVQLSRSNIFSGYVGRYICSDGASTTKCTNPYIIRSSTSMGITTDSTSSILVSSSVSYADGSYTLVDPVSFIWKNNYKNNDLKKYPYTCFSSSDSCSSVSYVLDYESSLGPRSIINFTDGEIMTNEIIESMFSNNNDSVIKEKIENWFSDELIDYADVIEDVYYCNDRKYSELDSNNAFSFNSYSRYNNSNFDLNCQNSDDKLSTGNGLLNYPIGLITLDEAILVGGKFSSTYLSDSVSYWTMTPSTNSGMFVMGDYLQSSSTSVANYVRPVISINNNFSIKGGTGSIAAPFVIE